ncbi:kinase-like domain-containing protein [Penicillium herquei]|nr:kinase-like domain-containing protein [Penicillium herquei]
MSDALEKSSGLASHFRENALPSILKKSRNTEIWGVDLKHAESQAVEFVVEKFLQRHSGIPAIQVARTSASLRKTLEWRSLHTMKTLLAEASPILPELDLCHITVIEGQYVLWVTIDEMVIKGLSPIHGSLKTSQGLMRLGLAVMEKLSMLLLQQASASPDLRECSASCVVEFKIHGIQNTMRTEQSFHKKLGTALEELVTAIRFHYPNIIGKAYIINPDDDYLANFDIDDVLFRTTSLLEKAEELRQYLGSQIPPNYGGTGKSLAASDLLRSCSLAEDPQERTTLDTPEVSTEDITETGLNKEDVVSTTNADNPPPPPKSSEAEEQTPRLIYSETIGPPSIILDPEDLPNAINLCPNKMGARIVFADSDTLVKYGHGVRLAEAEALHLAATHTTIAAPKLLSAYILDGVGYIVMSYELGEPLQDYWDRASNDERNKVLENLRCYVNQMRNISGDFIGGLDKSPCRDGIFEAGYGDYNQYSYGPYPSEESFNEGIIQALRDRIRPQVLEREGDIESGFFNSEYILYQTVRGLKNHKIVFTHGDLHPGNILVRADGTVVLLDWGLAGFWPEYWEFYRAMHTASWRNSWHRMVEKFIPPFYIEYNLIARVFGTVWN